MSTNRRMLGSAIALLLIVVPNAAGAAEGPAQTTKREHEIQEARAQRDREIRSDEPGAPSWREPAADELLADRMRALNHDVQRMHAELEELRSKEINLVAMQESAELEGRHNEALEVEQQLVHIRRDLRLREMELQRHYRERDAETERRELIRMTDRLAYVSNWRDVAFDPPQAVMMATQAIVELHLGSGEADRASDILEGLLERVDERGSRTAIRFALKDVYGGMGDRDRAAEQMALIIVENAQALAPR